MPNERRQGIFWMLTIPFEHFTAPTELPGHLQWIRGQCERGESTAEPGVEPGDRETGYLHWQIVVAFKTKCSLRVVRATYGPYHAQLTKSAAANDYVWKDDTSVGSRFEFGAKPVCRNSKVDYESVWTAAQRGQLDQIPAHVRVVSYRTLTRIAADFAVALARERSCRVYWGPTETGKSTRAWHEAGLDAYPKDPNTKFWCSYSGQEHVVIDEFYGSIGISHLLRWLDRRSVHVETKGCSRPLDTTRFWITSNVSPERWYPDAHPETVMALLRRLNITEMNEKFTWVEGAVLPWPSFP